MFKWHASAAAVFFLVAVAGGPLVGQGIRGPVGSVDVGARVADAARSGSIGDFAREVAREGVAAGMVVRPADLRPSGTLTPSKGAAQRQTAPLRDALVVFSERHTSYEVKDTPSGGLFVTLRSNPCQVPLSRSLKNLQISGPVYAVGYSLLKALNPGLEGPPPGAVRSGISAPGIPARETLIERPVFLSYQQLTLHEALDEVVRQMPGLVWVLAFDASTGESQPRCVLQWFTASETGVTSYDFLQLRRERNN